MLSGRISTGVFWVQAGGELEFSRLTIAPWAEITVQILIMRHLTAAASWNEGTLDVRDSSIQETTPLP